MDSCEMGLRPTSSSRPTTPDRPTGKQPFSFGMLQRLHHLFGKDEATQPSGKVRDFHWPRHHEKLTPPPPTKKRGGSARPVGVGLPRQPTFKRVNSEKRERLCAVEPAPGERRAYSASRQNSVPLTRFRSRSSPASSPPASSLPARSSAPAVTTTCPVDAPSQQQSGDPPAEHLEETPPPAPPPPDSSSKLEEPRLPRPASVTSSTGSYERQRCQLDERAQLNAELDTRWILNLSMHFRDKSDREKFFVTYAEAPNKWRRVTVSCDYRNAEPGSLEMDLKEISYQRDKSLQIYESIRDSLADIQFYDTVTNLKLETSDGRLHVHVTEDVNEIIPYPPKSSVSHILYDQVYRPKEVLESDLAFDAHLSGFVYRVRHKGKVYIKKEIPGPDTVDEFLYEVNALHALHDSENVIRLEGIVLDTTGQVVKGLLISYAERGAVVDLLYDHKSQIPWEDRELWAQHAVKGLSEIHEEGFVQGDFTLSNIVVDHDNVAKIIDINRRGCPVGWEPPELAKKIASNQRISMYIGQKSDLYQLGMTLWALAMDDDEPERHDPPLSTQEFPTEVPVWYQEAVRICLSERPRDRLSAKELLTIFPPQDTAAKWPPRVERPHVRSSSEKRYINPEAAVERDDLERFRYEHDSEGAGMYSPESSREDYTFTYPRSSNYEHDFHSESSENERPRGRRRVSDHDRLLQAQARNQQVLINTGGAIANHDRTPQVVNIEPNEPFCYEVGPDGHPAYIRDTAYEAHRRAVQQYESLRQSEGQVAMSDGHTIGRESSDHLKVDELNAPGRSEVSEATPRTSSVRLPETSTLGHESLVSDEAAEKVPNELTCLGSHPNVSVDSLEKYQPDAEITNSMESYVSGPPPRLPFADSGYNEPAYFGTESDAANEAGQHDLSNVRQVYPWSPQSMAMETKHPPSIQNEHGQSATNKDFEASQNVLVNGDDESKTLDILHCNQPVESKLGESSSIQPVDTDDKLEEKRNKTELENTTVTPFVSNAGAPISTEDREDQGTDDHDTDRP